MLFNHLLHLSHLHFNVSHFLLRLLIEVHHLLLGFISDLGGLFQGVLGLHVILIQILTHVFEFVKVPQLSLFVVHDDFFFFFDTSHDLVELGIQINMHTLNIVSLGFVTKEAEEDLFLLLQVDWFGAF